MYAIEILTWESQPDVTDLEMINAVQAMVPDLKKLPGFRYQSLSKNGKGQWVEIYYWDTAEDAHNSNDSMADKPSLQQLLGLIDVKSLTMEVFAPLQESKPLQL
ncbi:hypothetical protein [Kiloniella antarctica]|uniref:ABM domain-containing protein n=1 Tax=Kiloniella antarctica TaxID=1550907 RepID=A0ABW5BHU7_9PROT